MLSSSGEAVTRRTLSVWFLLPAALGIAAAARNPLAAPPPAPQANVALSSDKGKFRILLDGTEAGTEEFELAQSGGVWTLHGETDLRVPGSGETRSTGQLRLNADGAPVHYEWTAQTSKKVSGTVDFENGTAKTSLNLGGKDPVRQDFRFPSPRVAILDNNLYDQYELLARLYDWNANGTQTFPVLIPQDTTPGSITLDSLGPSNANGAQLQGLRVRSADLEIHAYFDAKHRLVRLEVPEAKVVVVRE
jgi:hypothetical protein